MSRDPKDKPDRIPFTILEKLAMTFAIALVGAAMLNVGGVLLDVYLN